MRGMKHLAAETLGLTDDDLIPYGRGVAKLAARKHRRGRVILVTAMSPTAQGEGKTTTSIGLADAMRINGENAVVALRQPSLGPLFGAKGGGTGSGKSRLVPSDKIDLHFTGDLHAIAAAHNLLAAVVDNHLHFVTPVALDGRKVTWPRAMDMNDRALRSTVIGVGSGNGVVREERFVATAASEVMAVMGLASDYDDLRARLSRMIVGSRRDGIAVTAGELDCVGAMMAILADAFLPNLVATAEGTPAFVHGGPFANIAHGCSSIVSTETALSLADWVVTEAGFGFDLGGEKFFDIKCRAAQLDAAAVVLVVTARSLATHGGGDVAVGLANVGQQIAAIKAFGKTPLVAINRHSNDTAEVIVQIVAYCAAAGVQAFPCEHWARGGAGATDLARAVVAAARTTTDGQPWNQLYQIADEPKAKFAAVARNIYGARDVIWSADADKQLATAVKNGAATLPVCVAKTQWSLSDDMTRLGRPKDFDIHVRGVNLAAGAGYWVAIAGDMMLMPGLPKAPRSRDIDFRDGVYSGLA
jgi:formate--tetrahydrofolate ligase